MDLVSIGKTVGEVEGPGAENGLSEICGSARTVNSAEWCDKGDDVSSSASSGDLDMSVALSPRLGVLDRGVDAHVR